MIRKCLLPSLVGVNCLMLSACGLPEMLSRPLSKSTAVRPASSSATQRKPPQTGASTASVASPKGADPAAGAKGAGSSAASVNLIGLGEQELRAKLGPPVTEEERPPGKIWRYRTGGCTLNVSLYPDVQTRKFGTLTYEVKSDDDTDEGKRNCLADLQSRAQAR
ncbi:hypothetical protein FHP25_13785 [Vineibacter terrae]|uniref:Lipoprotein SmpA/OmlA domain-containing protein n=1 Tax=Vineibacter terrae TaxID=2586908 RepID=A0A5C8PMR2_9HYPH|nr:hypothetical protein [Vineibacter terrae]TXL75714.1 hypothetical protein FHP25_13785 [Vineibacter terrae]